MPVTTTKPWLPNNCPVRQYTADNIAVGRCYHWLINNTCPLHGNVSSAVDIFITTGKLTGETDLPAMNNTSVSGSSVFINGSHWFTFQAEWYDIVRWIKYFMLPAEDRTFMQISDCSVSYNNGVFRYTKGKRI